MDPMISCESSRQLSFADRELWDRNVGISTKVAQPHTSAKLEHRTAKLDHFLIQIHHTGKLELFWHDGDLLRREGDLICRHGVLFWHNGDIIPMECAVRNNGFDDFVRTIRRETAGMELCVTAHPTRTDRTCCYL